MSNTPNVSGPDLNDENLVRGHEASEEILADLVEPSERVIDTNRKAQHGFDKCPRCGSTEIGYSLSDRALVCKYCRFEWNEVIADSAFGFDSPIEQLSGLVRGSGTQDIVVDNSVITLKCPGCGAEVVIKTDQHLQASCHWCRQILSVNHQIPNGAVPDAVLPFVLTRDEAIAKLKDFTARRKFYATKEFKENFSPEQLRGVFLPYMLVDGNLRAVVEGSGEVTLRTYRKQVSKDNYITVSDVQSYTLGRQFEFTVDDLITEANELRSNLDTTVNTNNVINAILPFDTKEAVAYNSNYLSGFTSEKRDLDISAMQERVEHKFLSIARSRADQMIKNYDRGVRWEREGLEVIGSRWVAVYLPVWLYSYRGKSDGIIHYIAVNARNGQTMGSVPISHGKLFAMSLALGITTTIITGILTVFGLLFGG